MAKFLKIMDEGQHQETTKLMTFLFEKTQHRYEGSVSLLTFP